jgi:four helix bundle protein
MSTIKNDIMKRLKAVAVKTGKLCLKLPHNIVNKTYIGQIIRCSSSASANYRATCRGKSKADFVNKLRIAEEELDETMHFLNYWQNSTSHLNRNYGIYMLKQMNYYL